MNNIKFISYNKKLKNQARVFRSQSTGAETRLWYNYLRNHRCRFLRQKPIGNYVVDFYSSKLKLVIELDGESHLDSRNYDDTRTVELENLGLQVIRFWNNDIYEGLDVVVDIIEKKIFDIEKSNRH